MRESKEIWFTKRYVVCLFAMVCCILWGSAFLGIKLGYRWWQIAANDTGSQLLFAGCRFFFAGIITIIIGSFMQKRILVPKGKAVFSVIKLSVFQTILQYLFFYMGLANTTGVKASIITAMNVFLAIIIAVFLFRQETLTFNKMLGCILGFIGVVLVNLQSDGIDFAMKWNGEGAIFLSALSAAVSSCLIKCYSKEHNAVMLSGYQFTLGGLVLVLAGKISGGSLTYVSVSCILILLYLALVSAIAYTIWGVLLSYNSVSRVAVFGFINPIAGVVLSAVILGEKGAFQMMTLVALLMVSLGIYVVNREKSEDNKPF